MNGPAGGGGEELVIYPDGDRWWVLVPGQLAAVVDLLAPGAIAAQHGEVVEILCSNGDVLDAVLDNLSPPLLVDHPED